jgi:hypothetical protein
MINSLARGGGPSERAPLTHFASVLARPGSERRLHKRRRPGLPSVQRPGRRLSLKPRGIASPHAAVAEDGPLGRMRLG